MSKINFFSILGLISYFIVMLISIKLGISNVKQYTQRLILLAIPFLLFLVSYLLVYIEIKKGKFNNKQYILKRAVKIFTIINILLIILHVFIFELFIR